MGGDFICNVYGKQIVTETTLSQQGYAVHGGLSRHALCVTIFFE